MFESKGIERPQLGQRLSDVRLLEITSTCLFSFFEGSAAPIAIITMLIINPAKIQIAPPSHPMSMVATSNISPNTI